MFVYQVMAGDTHICGECQEKFTSMEDFARHKYSEHGLRFHLQKSFKKKPHIFYPMLVKVHGWQKVKVKKEKKTRMTFTKRLINEGKTEKGTLCISNIKYFNLVDPAT